MKKLSQAITIGVVLALVAVVAIIVVLIDNKHDHTHYVCIEVNPRVEFLTDGNHKVRTIKPINQEAKELLFDEEFVGMAVDDACVKFVDLCARAGYIKVDGENAVKLSVLSGLNQKLEVDIQSDINKYFVDYNILGIVIDSSQDLQAYKDAKSMGVSTTKYDLMQAVHDDDSSMPMANLKKFSQKQLLEKIEDAHNNYSLKFTPQEIANKSKLIDFNRENYENHVKNITNESTREFKDDLKKFKSEKTHYYKVDFNNRYNTWLLN